MAIRAVLLDLDETLWHLDTPPDWDAVTARQADAHAFDFARLGLVHLDRSAFVRRMWASFSEALSNALLVHEPLADSLLAELR